MLESVNNSSLEAWEWDQASPMLYAALLQRAVIPQSHSWAQCRAEQAQTGPVWTSSWPMGLAETSPRTEVPSKVVPWWWTSHIVTGPPLSAWTILCVGVCGCVCVCVCVCVWKGGSPFVKSDFLKGADVDRAMLNPMYWNIDIWKTTVFSWQAMLSDSGSGFSGTYLTIDRYYCY